MANNKTHDFGEKQKEYSKKDNGEIPVYLTPKYLETKKLVCDLIDSGKYKGLNDSYFWILMNRTGSGKMAYTGLIISHDGMKIINDNLPEDKQVKASCFTEPLESKLTEGLYMVYTDNDTYEIGEISKANCMNPYPYAMLYKRTYDRVVKDKAKLYGLYSESEADEFRQPIKEEEKETKATKKETKKDDVKPVPEFATEEQLVELQLLLNAQQIQNLMNSLNITKLEQIKYTMASSIILKERTKQDEDNK